MVCIAVEEEQKRLAEERAVEAEKIQKIKENKKKVNEGKGPKTPKKGDNIVLQTSKKNEGIQDVQVKEEDGREMLNETKKIWISLTVRKYVKLKKKFKNL